MSGLEAVLDQYGLLAIFLVMLAKSIGVPVPVPADAIMLFTAARAAAGAFPLPEAFVVVLLALVLGSLVQYWLVRGPGRGLLFGYGRVLGMTPARLGMAAGVVQRAGPLGIGLSILTPGVRVVSVAACGLADVPVLTFLTGMVLGSTAFLCLHFFLGYLGAPLLIQIVQSMPLPGLLAVALLAAGAVLWLLIRRHQRPTASGQELAADVAGSWQEATCPVCLAMGAAERLVFGMTGYRFADVSS